jgi:3-oxoacyl-(acyl-carrier-protein) synthase/NAD(P)-dependent dehydrogenase (short-subunit alcohol dehydrogenase family)/acyl carrier protein
LWDLLLREQQAIGPIPDNRMDSARYHDPATGARGKINTRLGGYLDDIEGFDHGFFDIAPREAENIDPQQRILLELAWEALEDAGQDMRALEGSQTGVYVGEWSGEFEHRLLSDTDAVDLSMMLGAGRYAASGRLSYVFDFRGPSLTVDTACSSSLVGVHLAVRALREGACELALAGAANIILRPHIAIAYNSARVLSPDGRCKFGDAAADGFARSEGAGMVVLKTLEAAERDGDRIHAVILGSAISNDGRASGSLGRPSRAGQAAMLRAACRDAGVPPAAIGYVEAHGSGTRAGDPVELGALADVMAENRPADLPLLVGSVKSNIGHTEAAAGLAGLIKAALVVQTGVIPRSLNFATPNPKIGWNEGKLQIAGAAGRLASPRRAGVSSYGIAGANAHVVIAEAPARPPAATPAPGALLLPLSARSLPALRAMAEAYARLIARPDAAAAAICWNAATRRSALSHRATFMAKDAAGLTGLLQRFAAGTDAPAAFASDGVPPDQLALLSAPASHWVAGGAMAWRALLPPAGWADLPTYPWQRERCWAEAASHDRDGAGRAAGVRLEEAQRDWLYRLHWVASEPSGPSRPARWLVIGQGESAARLAVALDAAVMEGVTALAAPRGALDGVTDLAVLVEDGPDAAFLPVAVLQAALRARAAAKLWFVTSGGQAIAGDERVSVDLAACWGAARAVAEEHPQRWGGLADLGPGNEAALARHLRQDDGEDQVAFRGGRRFVLRLDAAPDTGPAYRWRQDGAYLITGGLGGIGLQVARRAADAGARRLILLGRTELPPRETWGAYPPDAAQAGRIAAIRGLEARGVAVHTACVDVADDAALRGFLQTYRAQGWPPILGVLHAAAELVTMLADDASTADFGRVLAAKLRAAQSLDRLLPDVELFALFSSFTAFLPHPGIAAYAASNAGLDALAQDRRARGRAAVSIGWTAWDGLGLAAGGAAAHWSADLARMGIQPLPPAAAAEIFAALCGDPEPTRAVMRVDWPALQRARAGRPQKLFANLWTDGLVQGSGVSGRLAASPPDARRPMLQALVRQAVGRVLKLPPERIDDRAVLGELGLNSLLAVELRNRLESAAGCALPATLAWNYPTVAAVTDFLARTLAGEAASVPAEGAPAPVAEPASDAPAQTVRTHDEGGRDEGVRPCDALEDISDDQALRLLMGMEG